MVKTLSAIQWREIEKKLESAFGYATLLVDGYRLSLAVQAIKPRRYVIMAYVNGYLRGEWILNDCEERRRFYREERVYLHSARTRALYLRKFGKRAYAASSLSKAFTMYSPEWRSFEALRRHLLANNSSIEVVNETVV